MKHLRILILIPLTLLLTGSVTQQHLMVVARKNVAAGGTVYTHYVDLDGTNDYITTPDSALNSTTGDLEIVVRVAMDDYSPAANQNLISKWNGPTIYKSWALIQQPTTLILYWSTSGSNANSESASVNTSSVLTDGNTYWIRCTFDVVASDTEVKFYYSDSSDYPSSWTQIGTTQTFGSASSIFDGTSAVILGSQDAGGGSFMSGKMFYAEIKNVIGGDDGDLVARFNASTTTDSGSTFPNVSGETAWTNNGGTYTAP